MAYAAVVSLIQVLENTQNAIGGHQISYEKQKIKSLLELLRSIADNFPVHPLQGRDDDLLLLEAKIRDAAYKAEDLVESRISQHFSSNEWIMGLLRKSDFKHRLETVRKEIDAMKQEVMRMQDSSNLQRRTHSSVPAGTLAPPGDVTMVGFEDELLTLRDRLTDHYQSAQGIIPIVGMVGSGKTTLARRLYNDPVIENHFDARAWVTVSNDYQHKKVLLDLLRCIKVLTPEMYEDAYDLATDLHQSLIGRRYLIVMDDVWAKEVWDDMRRLFPDHRMGSRILLTSRDSQVADYANSDRSQHQHKRFLDDTESWDLMRGIVSRSRESFDFHNLEDVGRRIARSCKGLPLSIVVVSGLLSNYSQTTQEWESFARNFNSNLMANEQCAILLSLIYALLPHRLQPCFLYMGVFPEDYEISVSKLIRLWIAEGYLESGGSGSLEEVGEKYLKDLISRQLILISERSSGKIRTCSIHDLLREFCLRKAYEENFLYSTKGASEIMEDPRRISCHSTFLGEDVDQATFSFVRSLISVSNHHVPGANDDLHHCKLLRVLNMEKVCLKRFPNEVLELVCLRYILLWCEEEEIHIPKAICNLHNLQTLIILQSSSNETGVHLPVQLWSLPKLRYLKFRKCYLPRSFWYRSIIENLRTLYKLSSSSCDVDFFKKTPNLKKLGIHVEQHSGFCLGNVKSLPELEKLEVIAHEGSKVSIPTDCFLPSLKSLTLNRTKLPWKDMSMVGSLPNLEELQLINNAFQGQEWEPIQDGFPHLKSLTLNGLDLEYWKADAAKFSSLVHLQIWECGKLKEISPGIGMIPTLETIELDDASPHAVTWANDIQQDRPDDGTESFRVYFYNIWSNTYRQRQEANEAYERRKKEEKTRKEEQERRENSERSFSGPPPMMHHHTSRMFERPSFDHEFGRPRFDGVNGTWGPHGSSHAFTSGLHGSRF